MELKKRYPRVERDEVIVASEDENAHLWAISYSDFLMALLSFFILFFSMEDQGQNRVVLDIARAFSVDGDVKGQSSMMSKETLPNSQLPKNIMGLFADLKTTTIVEDGNLIVMLPDNIFANGKHVLKADQEMIVNHVLERLLPFKDQIDLYIEGHTDDKPLHTRVDNIVFDNFLLSSLRASTALFKAKNLGFDEKRIFIQASSFHLRNSRTLSLRIIPRGVQQ